MKKAIFLDRDGTIIENKDHIHKLEDLKLIPNAIEALKNLRDKEYELFIITNQSGIGRKKFSLEDFFYFHNFLLNILEKNDINIKKTYFCPHLPEDKCICRKPNPHFVLSAKEEFNLDLTSSYVIGDNSVDLLLGKNAEVKSICVLTGMIKSAEEAIKYSPYFIAKDLEEAVKRI